MDFQVIDYTSVRGGVSVLTNKAEITTSYLIIQRAKIEDGGIYSCQNGVVDPAKVKVHVLTGNNPHLFVMDRIFFFLGSFLPLNISILQKRIKSLHILVNTQ